MRALLVSIHLKCTNMHCFAGAATVTACSLGDSCCSQRVHRPHGPAGSAPHDCPATTSGIHSRARIRTRRCAWMARLSLYGQRHQ